MAQRTPKPTEPQSRMPGFKALEKQTPVSPAVAKQRIENRKMPDRVYDPKKSPRRQPTTGQFAGPIMTAAAGGFSTGTVTAPASIEELARALKSDVDLIFKFVYDNIEFIPTYGSQKGALGCLVDGMGNAFDQAELMVELLREAGYTASYQLGDLEMLEADAAAIFGTDTNIWAISNLLAAGGIPNTTYWNWPNWYIRFTHCWVKVTISGTDYVFDPALKAYSTITGMNMDTALSYSTTTFMSNATSGATVTSDYVQDINRSNIRGDLDDFTENLIDYIQTNDPDATLNEVIGGRKIVAQSGTVRDTAHPDLQSGTTVTTWSTDIPVAYNATLNVAYDTIDETFYSKDIHGKRLTLFFNGSNEAELRLDGTLIDTSSAQGTGTWNSVWLEVVHPYPTTYKDEGHWQTVWAGKPYLIAQGWGNAGPRMSTLHKEKAKQNSFDGGADDDEDVFGEVLASIFHAWNAKKSWACDVFNRFTDCKTVLHHQTGLVGHYDTPLMDLGGIIWASGALDNDWDNVDTNDTALAMHGISFEEEVIKSVTGVSNGVSSTPLIDVANSNGDKIYDASSSNWTGTVEPALTNYSSGDKSTIKSWWIDNGWRVALPEDGDLGIDDWDGYGYYAISPWYGAIGIIQGGLKGTTGAEARTISLVLSSSQDYSNEGANVAGPSYNGFSNSAVISADPIDLRNGRFLYDNTDLSVGSQAYPYGLSFQRFYNSGDRLKDGPVGLGWSHNHNIFLSKSMGSLLGLSYMNPIQGASGLVEMYVTVDLFRDLTKPMDKWVTVAIANKWLNDRLDEEDGNITVHYGNGNATFIKLPDGSFVAPVSGNGVLESGMSGTYKLTSSDGIEYNFNSSGQISTIVYPQGVTITYTYTSGKLTSVTNGMSRTLTFTYTGDQITSVTDGTSRSVSYSYDMDGNLETYTDAAGEDTDYEYDQPGRMTKVFRPANPLSPVVTNTYDTLGRVKEQKDAYNNVWKFYLSASRVEEEAPNGDIRILELGSNGSVLKQGDKTTVLDGLGRATKVTSPAGESMEYTYDSMHRVTKATAKPKSGSAFSDVENDFTYDTNTGKLKTATDGNGETTTYNYNSTTGVLNSIQRPQVGASTPTVSFTYNARGQMLTKTDEEGMVTEYTYDSTTEKLTSVVVDKGTGKKNLTTSYGYDSRGNVISITDPKGNTTTMEYDVMRRLTKVTTPSPLSYQTKFTYDENGNRIKVERETGDGTTPWQIEEATYYIDDLLKEATDHNSNLTLFEYDTLRRRWKVTDAESRLTKMEYDSDGRLWKVTDPSNTVAKTLTYTDSGKLSTVEDASNNTTSYTYDDFDRVKKVTYADSTYTEFTYDDNGNVLTKRTRSGNTITYTYDELNRVKTKAPQGQPTVTYTLDLTGKITNLAKPVVSGDPSSGDFEYSYDSAGRLIVEEYPDGKTVEYEYDDNGNVTKITYPDSYYVEYVYDIVNRLTDVRLNGATSSALAFGYDKLSRRTSLTYENGVVTDYDHNWINDLTQLVHTFDSTSVTFDYAYNDVHELTDQDVDDSAFMWHPAAGGTKSYSTANNMNQYPSVGGTSYTYNDNGCLTDDGTWDFTYDTENHLLEADDGSTTVQFVYDPRHRQAQKTVGTAKTRYLYSGMQMIAEYDGSGSLQKKYVYGQNLDEVLIELDSSNNPTYLHHDKLGSIVATSDTNGDMVDSYAYSPWGDCSSMSGNSFGFTGQRYDSETGLYYFKNRYYSPVIGRFLQPDPSGYADGLNLYQYTGNSPLNFTDPHGLARVGGSFSTEVFSNSLVISSTNKTTGEWGFTGDGLLFNPGSCGCGCSGCDDSGGAPGAPGANSNNGGTSNSNQQSSYPSAPTYHPDTPNPVNDAVQAVLKMYWDGLPFFNFMLCAAYTNAVRLYCSALFPLLSMFCHIQVDAMFQDCVKHELLRHMTSPGKCVRGYIC